MTVSAVFTSLATKLLAANPTPAPALSRVITDLSNRWDAGGCPLAIIRMASDVDNAVSSETLGQPGLVRHSYLARILIFQGPFTTPDIIDQFHNDSKYWPAALAAVFAADMTLGGTVAFIGDDLTLKLFDYRVGVIPWLDSTNYWGLTVTLPVTEKISTNVG